MINIRNFMNELDDIKLDLKVLELTEKQHRYNQIEFKKKNIIQKLQKLEQNPIIKLDMISI